MSRRTGDGFREWCQCKSVEEIEEMYQGTSVHVVYLALGVIWWCLPVLCNGVLTGVLGVLAACVVVCVRGLAVVSGWCFVS